MNEIETLLPFPLQSADVKPGKYSLKCAVEQEVEAHDDQIQSEIWFTTEPLTSSTISRLKSLQLFAESRDQGYADVPSAGNWTWFEIAIYDNSSSTLPKRKDGVSLVWTSHYNRFLSNEFGWAEGSFFGGERGLLAVLEPNDVIGVRLCARFPGWRILARTGYLVFDLGDKPVKHPQAAGDFKTVLNNVIAIQDIFDITNSKIHAAFPPDRPAGLQVAESYSTASEKPLRVLSLDGGGVRGLSALYILKKIMGEISPDNSLKPYQVFDMIAGTSTGGLIAIMLGRLKMSADECIQIYQGLIKKIFPAPLTALQKGSNLAINGEFYNHVTLENAIKDVISQRLGGDADAKLLSDDGCKIFLMAVRSDASNNRGPVFLRSYTNPHKASLLPDCLLWQAARATSAAPGYFKPITVGQYELVDGGLLANNPLGWLWNECIDVFGAARSTNCFLSIGTGIPANFPLGKPGVVFNTDFALGLSSIATNAEVIDILLRVVLDAYAPHAGLKKYFRFSVYERIPGEDNFKDVGDLADITKEAMLEQMTVAYIGREEKMVQGCIQALREVL
ncbi:acyl transferase/acyl hydrolase/lysophospholipase [Hysterangium stoloniferum]|nr:acyl transferase/acyl hydrolase/lysophospholipase [Hysterangium stoloniferum]